MINKHIETEKEGSEEETLSSPWEASPCDLIVVPVDLGDSQILLALLYVCCPIVVLT